MDHCRKHTTYHWDCRDCVHTKNSNNSASSYTSSFSNDDDSSLLCHISTVAQPLTTPLRRLTTPLRRLTTPATIKATTPSVGLTAVVRVAVGQISKLAQDNEDSMEQFSKRYLDAVARLPQTQIDVTTQLETLVMVANKLGLYDAADYINRSLAGEKKRKDAYTKGTERG
jgi:hypothetical protein